MPIRFRCVYCTRLLGIASRKAGTPTRCPQCGQNIVVPMQSDDEVEQTQSVEPPRAAMPTGLKAQGESVSRAPVATKPKPKPRESGDEPLFIGDDIDDLLGVPKLSKEVLVEKLGPKPVSGMDALSLDDEKPGAISRQKMTLLIVALVLLLLLTFAAGFFLGMSTTKA